MLITSTSISVPFRGSLISNVMDKLNKKIMKLSVPFRGPLILNGKLPTIVNYIDIFPSPFGVLLF